ncbi:MAG: transposase [Euryarchaeota archaeon]|nr:transposase [Euryarchaeota archaeon]
MKNLILTSQDDAASMNIRRHLLDMCSWKKIDVFNGFPVYENERFYMVHIKGPKIHAEEVDTHIREKVGIEFDTLIVASKHRSASNMKSLTVHPIGNWGTAEAGGRSEHVVPTNPWLMTESLRLLKKYRFGEYNVSFEATHHGPYLSTKTFFIEIGSTEEEWTDDKAGEVIAKVILEAEEKRFPVVLGFGGGHYMPRLTDIALKYKVAVGHMVPRYGVPYITPEKIKEACEKSFCTAAYVHKKGLNGEERRKVREIVEKAGLKEISSKELEPL